jgi:hypothetical protein
MEMIQKASLRKWRKAMRWNFRIGAKKRETTKMRCEDGKKK